VRKLNGYTEARSKTTTDGRMFLYVADNIQFICFPRLGRYGTNAIICLMLQVTSVGGGFCKLLDILIPFKEHIGFDDQRLMIYYVNQFHALKLYLHQH
jgi:hypothetical protein